nr:immunoglobulin heavy chain junction region [Macaca mulatta]MOV53394.1 immunoglobulin heavy chain junction region [Macaca mulatta]MOV53732.1 immunoglobulin heavy chain junction region [Macaca mulatta]MOV53898.1 immunoglobulin heavy chain junction region [Macaca mulatta]MOV54069.1 immunoglobulin heavy chain junction region [Macaca mulatta]
CANDAYGGGLDYW